MPTTHPSHSAVTLILLLFLLALVDLAGASPPSIEAGHYEGLVDPAHPIGTLQGIAMDIRMEGSQGDVPFGRMKFRGETAKGEPKIIDIEQAMWVCASSVSYIRTDFGPFDAQEIQQCYYPIRWSNPAHEKLKDAYSSFSILGCEPKKTPASRHLMRLCLVSGYWFVFLGRRRDDLKRNGYVLTHPVFMEKAQTLTLRSLPQQLSRGQVDEKLEGRRPILPLASTAAATATRSGSPYQTRPLVDIEELPLGFLTDTQETDRFYTVCFTLQMGESGWSRLGQLLLASTALDPPATTGAYFEYLNATEDTPPSNVLILPLMPLVRKGDDDCYIFGNLTDPADQAEVEASLTAAGRAFGINNFTLESIRLHRSGVDGGHFELRLGTEASDPAKPELRVRLEHTPLTVDASGVLDVLHQSKERQLPSQFEASTSRGKQRSRDQPDVDPAMKKSKLYRLLTGTL
ncbi:hypothetical protein FOZ63_032780 [Perkinsus olseni]|uniref:Transmembrane protein n=1 Tax=Perkinsus olseni TaxID=32597 RepID=A0A7J6QEW2_PEROL|nr:hypothetical protein FOZ62_012084 [Perkinsus olseni]KAF4757854.1 hypothetical protein FOZ63_032780 [Perkinsus olseni]